MLLKNAEHHQNEFTQVPKLRLLKLVCTIAFPSRIFLLNFSAAWYKVVDQGLSELIFARKTTSYKSTILREYQSLRAK